MSFGKLSKAQIKEIVKQYNLKHHIPFSKVENGKRKFFSKKELIKKLEEHLYVDENNKVRRKNENLFTIEMPLKKVKKEHEKLVEVLKKADEKIDDKKVDKVIKEEIKDQTKELKQYTKMVDKQAEMMNKMIKPSKSKELEDIKEAIKKKEKELDDLKKDFEKEKEKLLNEGLSRRTITGRLAIKFSDKRLEILEKIEKLKNQLVFAEERMKNVKEEDKKEVKEVKEVKEIKEEIVKKGELIKIGGITKIMDIKTKDEERFKKISKCILDDMKNVNYKVFVVSTRQKTGHTKTQKMLIDLIDDLKHNSVYEEWGRGQFDITSNLTDKNYYDYVVFNFSKENGSILLRSIALMVQDENYIYIKELSGSKYTYRIFEYLKNLMEKDKGKSSEFKLNWSKVKYLTLESLTSFNTLYFYGKQNMEIERDVHQELDEDILKRFHLYARHKPSYEKLRKDIIKGDLKGINEFMEDKSLGSMPELFYFFNVKGADKAKKELEEEKEDDIIPFDILQDFKDTVKVMDKLEKEKK